MKCNNCGEEVLEGANFCPKCGTKVEVKEEKVVEATPVVETAEEKNVPVAVEIKEEVKVEESKPVKEPEIVVNTAEVITPVPKPAPTSQPKAPVQAPKAPVEETSGFAVAALVLGIASALLLFEHGLLNLTSAILAIIFGAIGRKKKGSKTMGTVGMVLGIVSISILALIFTIIIFVGATFITLGVAGALN